MRYSFLISILFLVYQSPVSAQDQKSSGEELEVLPFAREQVDARQAGKPFKQLSVEYPNANRDQAEFVQGFFVGWFAKTKGFAGVKGAVVGKGGQEQFAIDGPLSAVLFQDGWIDAKEGLEIPILDGTPPAVETELGVIFGQPVTEEIADVKELMSKVRAIVPVIELPAGKHEWPQPPMAVDLVAANVDSDRYIVGPATEDLSTDLDSVAIKLDKDGAVVYETTGGDANHGQWWNFLQQVNWAAKHGFTLEPGNLIITGALGKIVRDGKGTYRADYGELGVIEFSITDS